jgi:archaellum component FlaC
VQPVPAELEAVVKLAELDMVAVENVVAENGFDDELEAFDDELEVFDDELEVFDDELEAFDDELEAFDDELEATGGLP